MKQCLYTIYDKVAEQAGPLFCAINDGVAIRSTINVLKEVIDIDEYALYKVGTFEPHSMQTGFLLPEEIDFKLQLKMQQHKITAVRMSDDSPEFTEVK